MKMIENIIVMSGGVSSRFWPLSDKNTFTFLGKPLLTHTLSRLQQYAKNLFVVVNDQNQQALVEIAKQFGAKIIQQNGVGQGAAIQSAEGHVNGPALTVNNVDLYNPALIEAIIEKVEKTSPDCLLVSTEVQSYVPGGYLKSQGDRVTAVIEKPGADNMPSHNFRLNVDYFADIDEFITALKNVVTNPEFSYEEAITTYIKNGKKVHFVEYHGPWATIKYPWHVLSAQKFFLSQQEEFRAKNVVVDKTAVIDGPVYLEDGVVIGEYAKIVGPTYIGRNTRIGTYAMVVESMIGENCLIGGYSEVTRSYLGNRVFLHRNYVGDSVLENNILFGAGAVAANFRFDEKTIASVVKGEAVDSTFQKLGVIIGSDVKVGVNSSLMPGVKIASGSRVMPATMVKRDIRQ